MQTAETKADCNRKLGELWRSGCRVLQSGCWGHDMCVLGLQSPSHTCHMSFIIGKHPGLLRNFPCFQIAFMHLEQNGDTLFSQEFQLHLLPLELLEKCPMPITDYLPDYKLVCWHRGKMWHLMFLSLIKIFFTKNHQVSTPTVETNISLDGLWVELRLFLTRNLSFTLYPQVWHFAAIGTQQRARSVVSLTLRPCTELRTVQTHSIRPLKKKRFENSH